MRLLRELSSQLETQLELGASELKSIQKAIEDLTSRSLIDRLTQAKDDPSRIANFRTRILLAMAHFSVSVVPGTVNSRAYDYTGPFKYRHRP